MLYTVGHTESYSELLNTEHTPMKLGRRDNYKGKPYTGGSVWLTESEAYKSCPKGYTVYGLDTVRENTWIDSDNNRYLIGDALIIDLTKIGRVKLE